MKCYFNFCNSEADTQVVTSFSMGGTHPHYNYVCNYHIKNITWIKESLEYPFKKDMPEIDNSQFLDAARNENQKRARRKKQEKLLESIRAKLTSEEYNALVKAILYND